MADLEERKSELKEISFALISNGAPHYIQGFREDTGYTGEIYTDPSLESYRLLHFKKSYWSLVGVQSMKEMIRASTSGYHQLLIQGEPDQQGGVVVIDTNATVHYFYKNKEAGDHAPLEQIIEAYQKAVAR